MTFLSFGSALCVTIATKQRSRVNQMPLLPSIVRALVVSALGVTLAGAQSPSPSKPEQANFADEPYVVEQLRNTLRFEADGKGQHEMTMRIRIQSESAVREFGLLVYPFMASFETLDVVYARVRKPDGSVVDTPADEIQELDTAVSREAPMYTDQREKHVAVKALGVGDVLEADFRWTIREPIAPGHFWYDHNFFESGICLDEQLEINVPLGVPVKVAATTSVPQVRDEGSRRIYTLHSSHLQKAQEKDEDQKIPAWEKDFHGLEPPAARITSFTSWADVGAWYAGLQQHRVEVTPRIRSTAEEITKGKVTDEEKIRALYDYVATRYRYIGIDLGVGRYTPHAAEDVLANRYGDCKDKHTLFAALLEAAGLHAFPALISTKYKLDTDFPSPSLFNHVITAIPQGDSYLFLDTTPEVAPYGYLLAGLRDRQALVMPTNLPAKLVVTPANPPFLNHESFLMEASIDSQGTLDGKARFEERGDPEVILRLAYRNTPQNEWKELTQEISSRMGYGGTVSQVAAAQPEKTADPFWLSYTYHRTDYSDWKEHRITLPFPPMFLQELNEAQKKSKDPLPLGSPQEVVHETSLKLPEGIQPLVPSNVEEKSEFGEYKATYSFENGVLHGTRRLSLNLREVPGAQRASYSVFLKAMQDDTQRWVILIGNFDQDSPLRKGQALLREGKNADAIAVLEKASEANTDDKQIAFALGTAYLRLPDETKAAAQFDKLLADKPNAATLNGIAYEYANANRRLKDAQDYAARAVADTSAATMKIDLDSAGPENFLHMGSLAAQWDTLGWVKFRAGDVQAAEKAIISAWALWPRAVIGEHLVEIYEKLGNKREADRICRLALSAPGLNDEPDTKEKLQAAQLRIGITKPETGTVNAKSYHPPGNAQVELSEMRTIKLPGKVALHGKSMTALFAIVIENGNRTSKARYISGDRDLISAGKALASANYHQPFPDDAPARVFRAGWVSCSKYTSECTMILFLVDDKPSLGMVKPHEQ